MNDPLVIAGGPCAKIPSRLAPFIDLFVTGDGEPSLPAICQSGSSCATSCRRGGGYLRDNYLKGSAGRQEREEMLAILAAELPFAYVPRFYEPEYRRRRPAVGHPSARGRTCPTTIEPS